MAQRGREVEGMLPKPLAAVSASGPGEATEAVDRPSAVTGGDVRRQLDLPFSQSHAGVRRRLRR
jgi:hypothetical protein